MVKKKKQPNNKATSQGKQKKISEQALLNYLRSKTEIVKTRQIAEAFSAKDNASFENVLLALEALHKKQKIERLSKHRWASSDAYTQHQGRVMGHPDGHGYVFLDEIDKKVYLSQHQMRELLHGDFISFRLIENTRKKRSFADAIEVIERGVSTLVGRFYYEGQVRFVVPEDTKYSQDIYIAPEHTLSANQGEVVQVKILQAPTKFSHPVGEIIEVIGDYNQAGMETAIALRKHSLPFKWGDDVIRQKNDFDVNQICYGDEVEFGLERKDCRSIEFVTIDGEDAKDFDDAVYCQVLENGSWQLMVAIADVSYYVKLHSAIDKEAYHRGTSVYFPNEVIPMLPPELSNELCSLKPNVDRYCMMCEMHISADGEIKRYSFYPAIMHSHGRLTYDQVFGYLQATEATHSLPKSLHQQIDDLDNLAQCLLNKRRSLGTIELDITEPVLNFNAQLKIESIGIRQRNRAHRLIEECMLAANICASLFLDESEVTGIYRIHDMPDESKVEELRTFLRQFKCLLSGGSHPSVEDYAAVMKQFKQSDTHSKIVKNALLRSMKQAVYSIENNGHFALNFDSYTHFTSPIRRYPDLIVHRQIKRLLIEKNSKDDSAAVALVEEAAAQLSVSERRAEMASRDVIQWLKCEYISRYIGESFHATVVAVTDFGLFVELNDLFIEGLVHISALQDDYYRFNEETKCLIGESTGVLYQTGQSLNVQVARVDRQQGRIDFVLINNKKTHRSKKQKSHYANPPKQPAKRKTKKNKYANKKKNLKQR